MTEFASESDPFQALLKAAMGEQGLNAKKQVRVNSGGMQTSVEQERKQFTGR